MLFSLNINLGHAAEALASAALNAEGQIGQNQYVNHWDGQNKPQSSQLNTFGNAIGQGIGALFTPKTDESYRTVQFSQLSKYQYDTSKVSELPQIRSAAAVAGTTGGAVAAGYPQHNRQGLSFVDAIQQTLNRHPLISQSIANLASQNANIDVAKSGYYPQLSGGIGTGDMTTGERGRQLISLNATQMVYDFGKVKSTVDEQRAKLITSQAGVLVTIDEIALQVSNAIVNIKRFQEVTRIANEQIVGISRIAEIADLRAKAGISSQADPVQAQSYLEAARSNLIAQQTQLRIYEERLRTLLGYDVANKNWQIPNNLIDVSNIYAEIDLQTIPRMIQAQSAVDVAKLQKKQVDLSRYPTLSVKGSLSQALNGVNPNNNKDDGFYNSIMFEASSNFYQGGATASRSRAASFAEEAARSQVNSVYMEVLNQTRATRENVENKQRQTAVLANQQAISIRTKELYQEQYKLGTRTVLDLLNAEQSIHSTNMQLENLRYDIYDSLVQYIAVTGKTREIYQLNNISIQGVEIQP
ncbi:adhesin transport system outer membrane protein [Acinetobacter calcoaceticus]|uniref:Adhesin transport system outer membrane protein n=1 Tax=Acinetobacter calcoaceticus TaxID=471 RepID=A0A4V2QZ88_ACICA|nr:adhesin transport system outer membrane protein [Acinetobacter calcoaceticus]